MRTSTDPHRRGLPVEPLVRVRKTSFSYEDCVAARLPAELRPGQANWLKLPGPQLNP
jgi:hypothetical protein